MLGGTVSRHAAGFVAPRNGAVRLQVEMLLAAYHELAVEFQGTRLDDRRVTIGKPEGASEETAHGNRVLNGENRRQGFVFDVDPLGAEARSFESLAQHPGDGLLVKHYFGREYRFVVAAGSSVAFARNIGSS